MTQLSFELQREFDSLQDAVIVLETDLKDQVAKCCQLSDKLDEAEGTINRLLDGIADHVSTNEANSLLIKELRADKQQLVEEVKILNKNIIISD